MNADGEHREGWFLFAAVFLVLAVFRWDTLQSPLYEDQSVGFGREAEYLARTGFDYYRLRYEEPHFMRGGTARSYMISAIPTVLAGLERAIGSASATLFIWHATSFLLAAFIARLTYVLLAPSIGRAFAALTSLSLVTTPMFVAQADLAGMELPLAAFSLMAVHCLVRERFVLASAMCGAAFLMKASGLIVGGAILAMMALLWVGGPKPLRARLSGGIVGCALVIALSVAALWWGDDTAVLRATFPWPSAFRFPRVVLWSPDLWVLLTIAAVAAFAAIQKIGVQSAFTGIRRGIREGDRSTQLALVSTMVVVGSVASMFGYIFIPRYFILPLCFLYLLLGIVLFHQSHITRAGRIVMSAIVVFNLANARGALYPSIASVGAPGLGGFAFFPPRSCAFSERSLEYLDDHGSSIDVIRRIAREHSNDSVFLDMPHWIYLTSPFVGYVSHAPALSYLAKDYSSTIREFRDRAILLPPEMDLLFLWTGKSSIRLPGPSDDVDVIWSDKLDPPMALVRVRRDKLPKSPEGLEDWYLDHTWSADHALHRVTDRYEFLRKTGRSRRAYDELHIAKWLNPVDDNRGFASTLPGITADLESSLSTTARFRGSTWSLLTGAGAHAVLSLAPDGETLKVSVAQAGDRDVRLLGLRRFVRKGDALTIAMKVKSSRNARMNASVVGLFEPSRGDLWSETIAVRTDWQEVRTSVQASQDEHDAALQLLFEDPNTEYEISEVEFAVTPAAAQPP